MRKLHLPRILNQCRFEDVLDSLPFAIFIKDTERRHVWSNRKFEDITGLTRESQLGEISITTLAAEHQKIARQSDLAILSGEPTHSYDYRMTCPCGLQIDTRFLKVPARNPRGEIVGIIGIATDTTSDCETMRALLNNLSRLEDQKGYLEQHANDLQSSLAFTEEQAAQMAELAEQIEVQRQNIAEQNTQIRRMMHKDENTGLHNRRYFFEYANDELSKRHQHGEKGVLAMLDIDNFKTINDTHGHAGGDVALQCFAQTVANMLPDPSMLCRFGGEEFVVITPPMPTAYGVRLLDKVRKAVAENICTHRETDFSFTVSIGVTEICQSKSLDTLLQQADDALYQAKDAGRNRVILLEG